MGVKPDRVGHIEVDEHLRSGVDRLWAVGDIRGGPAFTHTVYDDFRVMHSQFLGDGSRTRGRIVPYAMFTEPELGPVGLK